MDIKTVRAHKYKIPRSTKILHLYLNYCNIGVNRFMYLFSKPAEDVQIYLTAYSSTHVYNYKNCEWRGGSMKFDLNSYLFDIELVIKYHHKLCICRYADQNLNHFIHIEQAANAGNSGIILYTPCRFNNIVRV